MKVGFRLRVLLILDSQSSAEILNSTSKAERSVTGHLPQFSGLVGQESRPPEHLTIPDFSWVQGLGFNGLGINTPFQTLFQASKQSFQPHTLNPKPYLHCQPPKTNTSAITTPTEPFLADTLNAKPAKCETKAIGKAIGFRI